MTLHYIKYIVKQRAYSSSKNQTVDNRSTAITVITAGNSAVHSSNYLFRSFTDQQNNYCYRKTRPPNLFNKKQLSTESIMRGFQMDNDMEEDDALELIFRRIKELEQEIKTSKAITELTQMLVLELRIELKVLKEELSKQQVSNINQEQME